MSSDYPDIPSSFDPAIHLHTEADLVLNAPASPSHSDELEALQQCIESSKAQKTREGIVIQHRAWKTAEAFRSEEDRPIDTPLKPHYRSAYIHLRSGAPSNESFLSSPPSLVMPLASSPVTYPPSSVPQASTPKKRKRSDAERSPLKDVQTNQQTRRIGGFLDDSDEEDIESTVKVVKRRVINISKELPTDLEAIDTPPASQEYTEAHFTVPVDHLGNDAEATSISQDPLPLGEEPTSAQPKQGSVIKTAAGKSIYIPKKSARSAVPFEQLIASRSAPVEGRAQRSYYGIDIHSLLDEAKILDEEKNRVRQEVNDFAQPSVEQNIPQDTSGKSNRTLMWTEKYRAKKFTDLVGDERTHRSVLRWLKGWDAIVFPGSNKTNAKASKKMDNHEEQKHRKILLLTGPPGLGKTTLAHVCARQAGYEVQEINASDERSSNVVKGRIRDMVGTENVRGINTTTANGRVRKAGKPVCVVVDEVDGVVSGSGGGGEGGFIKALIDLINLDERNSNFIPSAASGKKRKSRDKFRLLRPLILVCNDVYHPSLRPLRQSSCAEIIHIRKPSLNMVVSRLHSILGKEGIPADSDGVRRLCEATWGVSTKKEGGTGNGTGEGDIRSVMVVCEWVAGRLRASKGSDSDVPRLTRHWVEQNIINDLGHGGGAARSLGRGGTKDVVDRVFREGAGFPKQAETTIKKGMHGVIGVAEAAKRRAMARLGEMVNASGDVDRIVSDCFTAYPEKQYQDDTFLTKPNAAYEWLHFHNAISDQVNRSQEWELAPYLSQSVLAFHDLFASPRQSSNPVVDPDAQPTPFSGPGAAYAAAEARKATRAQLMGLQSTLSLPLTRLFRSPEEIALELLPYALRMLSPDVKPVLVNTGPSGSKSFATASVRKASEKALVKKAVEAMAAIGVRFERSRVEFDHIASRSGGWILRMEPPLDQLAAYETLGGKKDEKVRYAVRSVLDAEWKKESARMDAEARKRRGGQLGDDIVAKGDEKSGEQAPVTLKDDVARDFFGRVIKTAPVADGEKVVEKKSAIAKGGDEGRIWVSFNEGYSNAVRKPITLDDLMRGL